MWDKKMRLFSQKGVECVRKVADVYVMHIFVQEEG